MIYDLINELKEVLIGILVKGNPSSRLVYIKPESIRIKNKRNNNILNNLL